MSIFGAMFSGVTGLNANSQALGMIADNIANVNTIGYKGSLAQFSTLVTRGATVNTYTPGGVQARPIQGINRQGLLQSSPSDMDIAIAGQGFFVVNEAASPTIGNEYLFTRAGSFAPDKNGDLVNSAGYYLQGWPLTNGTTLPTNTTTLTNVQTVDVAGQNGTATVTQNVTLGLNLPSTAAVGDSFSTTVQIFDALGNAQDLEVQFTKTAVNSWSITVQDPVLASTGAVSGTVTPVARSITFNGDGTPNAITFPDIDITGWTTGASNSTITFDVGTANQNDGVTQLAGEFSVTSIDQDGLRVGQFVAITISEDGTVTALFDNGERLPIYKLPIALFPNPNGLGAVSGNAYRQTDRSGSLLLQQANTGGTGTIASSALESSTVDLAEEFTKLITTQRAYSASARIITTADEMLEELIRLRR